MYVSARHGRRTLSRRTFLRRVGLAVPVVLLSPIASACSGSSGGGTTSQTAGTATTAAAGTAPAQPQSVVTFAMTQGIPAHLDATLLNDTNMAGYVKAAIHDTLLLAEQDGSVTPAIATSIDQADDAIRAVLRDGVVFHNGRALTAADVKYTFDRVLDEEVGSVFRGDLEPLDSVEAVDDHTVEFRLSRPFAPLPLLLADVPIIPEGSGDQQKREPVGAGPFAFESWEEGVSISVRRFPDYYGEQPQIEGIEMVSRSDATAMRAGFQSGELDIIAFFAWTDTEPIRSAVPDAEMITYPGGFVEVTFNTARPPFDDPRVRQAFSLAVDKQAVGVAMYGPDATPLPSFYIPESHPLHPQNAPTFDHDPERAGALFREAGIAEGSELTILVPDLPTFRPAAPVLQDGLRQAGINLNAPITPAADWVDKVFTTKNYDSTIWGVSGLPDPALLINRYYLSDSPSNFSQYQNEELDRLLQDAAGATDEASRRGLYEQVTQHLHDATPGFPVVQTVWNIATSPAISGFEPRPAYRWTWSQVRSGG